MWQCSGAAAQVVDLDGLSLHESRGNGTLCERSHTGHPWAPQSTPTSSTLSMREHSRKPVQSREIRTRSSKQTGCDLCGERRTSKARAASAESCSLKSISG